jgi:Pyruvate/2-oxoacid:ferredoxin oxidoreductase gamma subunit
MFFKIKIINFRRIDLYLERIPSMSSINPSVSSAEPATLDVSSAQSTSVSSAEPATLDVSSTQTTQASDKEIVRKLRALYREQQKLVMNATKELERKKARKAARKAAKILKAQEEAAETEAAETEAAETEAFKHLTPSNKFDLLEAEVHRVTLCIQTLIDEHQGLRTAANLVMVQIFAVIFGIIATAKEFLQNDKGMKEEVIWSQMKPYAVVERIVSSMYGNYLGDRDQIIGSMHNYITTQDNPFQEPDFSMVLSDNEVFDHEDLQLLNYNYECDSKMRSINVPSTELVAVLASNYDLVKNNPKELVDVMKGVGIQLLSVEPIEMDLVKTQQGFQGLYYIGDKEKFVSSLHASMGAWENQNDHLGMTLVEISQELEILQKFKEGMTTMVVVMPLPKSCKFAGCYDPVCMLLHSSK